MSLMQTSDEQITLFSHQPHRGWLAVALLVTVIHLGIILWGVSHRHVQLKSKVKTKVLVQTVSLNSLQKNHPFSQETKISSVAASKKDEEKVISEATPPVRPPVKSDSKVISKPVAKKAEEKKLEIKKEVPKSISPTKKSLSAAPAKTAPIQSNAQSNKNQIEEKRKETAEKKQAEGKAATEKENKEEKERRQKLSAALGALGKSKQSREKIIQQSKHSEVKAITDIKAVGSLEIDVLLTERGDQGGRWEKHEIDYRDGVGNILKAELKLPEYGAVTIRLTLNTLGKVIKVEVVESQSVKNREYVEKSIPMLSFLPLAQQFRGESQCTFSFILKNSQ